MHTDLIVLPNGKRMTRKAYEQFKQDFERALRAGGSTPPTGTKNCQRLALKIHTLSCI